MNVDEDAVKELLDKTAAIVVQARRQGLNFNIFDILKRTKDEVHGHSAFLAELLHPQGSHGQGTVFLRRFLQCVNKCLKKLDKSPVAIPDGDGAFGNWSVTTEQAFSWHRPDCGGDEIGRIDILIEGPRDIIVIENKIYAADQEDQLGRYGRYIELIRKGREPHILYLTLYGRPPSKQNSENVVLVSYKEHVRAWLDECIPLMARVPRVCETLVQYLNVIHRLTTGTINRELAMKITDLLKEEKSLRAAVEIEKALPGAKVRVLLGFWMCLKEQLSERLGLKSTDFVDESYSLSEERVRAYYKPRATDKRHFGVGFLLPSDPCRTIALLIELGEREIYYGFGFVDPKTRSVLRSALASEEPHVRQLLTKLQDNAPSDWQGQDSWHLIYRYPRTRLDFGGFGPECAALADPRRLQVCAEELADEIVMLVHSMGGEQ